MLDVLDQDEVVYSEKFSQSSNYVGRRYAENADDAIHWDEDGLDSDCTDFCLPVEDWMLD